MQLLGFFALPYFYLFLYFLSAGPTLRIQDSAEQPRERERTYFCSCAVSQLASAVAVTFGRFSGDKLDRVAVRAAETETTWKLKSAARFTVRFQTGPALLTEILKSVPDKTAQ